jgi:YHS domain-containing protein
MLKIVNQHSIIKKRVLSMTLVSVECEWCGANVEKKKKEYNRQLRNGRDYFFCDLSCAAKYRNQEQIKEKEKQAEENPISWNEDIAYLTGLIASDGTLGKERPRVGFINSEFELIEHVRNIVKKEITGETYSPQEHSRDNSIWWNYQFTSRRYYYFLQQVGLTPNKSLTIGELDINNEYFVDFLRGIIDGDGGFIEYGTKFRCFICSGSKNFLNWLYDEVKNNIGVKGGWIRHGNGVYDLGFAIRDSLKIAEAVYQNVDKPKLTRKYKVVEEYIN